MNGRWVSRTSALAFGLGLVFGTDAALAAESYGPVKPGESLWTVVRKAAPGRNPAEAMKEILARNPQAFVNGDMNKLKLGAVLALEGAVPATAATPAPTSAQPRPAAAPAAPRSTAGTTATRATPPVASATPPPTAAPASSPAKTVAKPAAPVAKAATPATATVPVAAAAVPPPPRNGSAGEIVKLVGRASAATDAGDIRPLEQGNPVNTGETVVTAPASFVRMKLADGAYIVLRPSTRFQIAQYKYSESGDGDSSVFNLLKGGFRAVTGAIGKRNRSAVSYRTAVATIGIRGTDIEALDCTDGCPDLGTDIEQGMYLKTHTGTAVVDDKTEVPAGDSTVTTPDGVTKKITFDGKSNPLNTDPTPSADPDKC